MINNPRLTGRPPVPVRTGAGMLNFQYLLASDFRPLTFLTFPTF